MTRTELNTAIQLGAKTVEEATIILRLIKGISGIDILPIPNQPKRQLRLLSLPTKQD